MTERLSFIFAEIPRCETFADIACDHGYIAFAMLKEGRCERAYVSDVSAKSLGKAETLLADFIIKGKAQGFVSDGFDNVPKTDCALIAGVGGELITDILKRAERAGKLPDNLILQPMKHCDKVRRLAVELGYQVKKDFTVKADGQFYDIISLVKGKDFLTDEETEFGRTNVRELPLAFKEKIKVEIGKILSYTESETMTDATREKMLKKAERLKKYV
ncbi:MAG: SAM-dependent methyltransferase [Clostridia bacterium]|nr:SAM-dependent methyltransferase [Clostridia bacterium]